MIVRIGVGKIVFLFAFLGLVNAVDNDVVHTRVESREESVPFALDEFCLYAEIIGDILRYLHVKTHQFVLFVVIGPRRPCAFHGDGKNAFLLDALEQGFIFVFFFSAAPCRAHREKRCRCQHGDCSSDCFHLFHNLSKTSFQ